jgi:hypothetical protein
MNLIGGNGIYGVYDNYNNDNGTYFIRCSCFAGRLDLGQLTSVPTYARSIPARYKYGTLCALKHIVPLRAHSTILCALKHIAQGWVGLGWVGYGLGWVGLGWVGLRWCGVVWYGMVWCGVVWYGMVWCGMGFEAHSMVWYGKAHSMFVPYHTVAPY